MSKNKGTSRLVREQESQKCEDTCKSCKDIITEEDAGMSCDVCEQWDCLTCSGISQKKDGEDTGLHYICYACRSFMPTLKQINEQLEQVKTTQEASMNTLQQLEQGQKTNPDKLISVDEKLSELEAGLDVKIRTVVQEEVKQIVSDEMDKRVEQLKKNIEAQVRQEKVETTKKIQEIKKQVEKQAKQELEPDVVRTIKDDIKKDMADIIQQQIKENVANCHEEERQRELRKLNLVVYGVKESDSKTDQKQIKDIIKVIDPEDKTSINVKNFFRIGNKAATKPRPLKITVENREQWRKLITDQKRLKDLTENEDSSELKNVSLAPDRTMKQREERRELQTELQRRINAGESDLSIRRGKIIQKPKTESKPDGTKSDTPFQ